MKGGAEARTPISDGENNIIEHLVAMLKWRDSRSSIPMENIIKVRNKVLTLLNTIEEPLSIVDGALVHPFAREVPHHRGQLFQIGHYATLEACDTFNSNKGGWRDVLQEEIGIPAKEYGVIVKGSTGYMAAGGAIDELSDVDVVISKVTTRDGRMDIVEDEPNGNNVLMAYIFGLMVTYWSERFSQLVLDKLHKCSMISTPLEIERRLYGFGTASIIQVAFDTEVRTPHADVSYGLGYYAVMRQPIPEFYTKKSYGIKSVGEIYIQNPETYPEEIAYIQAEIPSLDPSLREKALKSIEKIKRRIGGL
jgi:hypothetical protein